MRFLPFIFALLIYSCSNSSVEEKPVPKLSLEEQIELKKKNELATGVLNDTVILDHVFGMSKKEIYKHKNKLHKNKRIYGIYKTRNTRIFAYDLKTKNFDKLTLYFDAFFHNDEMYRMECIPKLKNKEDLAEVQNDLIDLYELKYGKAHFTVPQDTANNIYSKLWITNNQTIEINRDEKEVVISYTDMKREMELGKDI